MIRRRMRRKMKRMRMMRRRMRRKMKRMRRRRNLRFVPNARMSTAQGLQCGRKPHPPYDQQPPQCCN